MASIVTHVLLCQSVNLPEGYTEKEEPKMHCLWCLKWLKIA